MRDSEFWFKSQALLDFFSAGVNPSDALDADVAMILGNEDFAALRAGACFASLAHVDHILLSGGVGLGTRLLRSVAPAEFHRLKVAIPADLNELPEAHIYAPLLPALGVNLPVEAVKIEAASQHTFANFVNSKPIMEQILAHRPSKCALRVGIFQTPPNRLRAVVAGRLAWLGLPLDLVAVDFGRIRLDPTGNLPRTVITLVRLVGWKSKTACDDTSGEVEVLDRFHPGCTPVPWVIRSWFYEVQAEVDRRLCQDATWSEIVTDVTEWICYRGVPVWKGSRANVDGRRSS